MKKKLSLKDLHIQSFVTDLEQNDQKNFLGGQQTQLCNKTLPVADCVSQINFSQCPTCGIACTTPQYCTYE